MDSKGVAVSALKKAAILDINKGHLDKAVVKLQKLLQVCKARKEDAASKSTIPLWSMLGEAYKKQNSLQSAVRVFKHVLEIDPESLLGHIQLMNVYQLMGKYEESLVEGRFIKSLKLPVHLQEHFDLQYSYVVSLLAKSKETFEEKVELIKEIFPSLNALLKKGMKSVCLLKTLEGVCWIIQGFHGEAFMKSTQILNLSDYGISTKIDLANRRCEYLKLILEKNNKFADSWYDLALCLLGLFDYTGEKQHLESSANCIKVAINSKCSMQKKSQYYLSLGVVYSKLFKLRKASHCFIRSIQLNKLNDKAWCALSLIYLRSGQYTPAFQTMQLAQQVNPDYMITWFAHALHAESTNHYETMDLYRHTIFLYPHKLAVQKYSYYISKALESKKKIDQHTMIDCKKVLSLCDFAIMNPRSLLAIVFLAERFWYLEQAFRRISSIQDYPMAQKHIGRITVKATMGESNDAAGSKLSNLAALYKTNIDDMLETIKLIPNVGKLVQATKAGDVEEFSEVFVPEFYPLVVCLFLLYGFEVTDGLKQALKSKRPLHSLADIYPEGLRSIEELNFQKEEGIVVTEDNLTTRLYALLKRRAESLSSVES
ncbi:unnamed protein product [Bursaphelenchus xylophilus]|uniref:(pine wood nematode) hypothetical protein n=1 Tax=Bursaphelenchus xylophilus TaxID=6326 RepID=A0A1I7RL58_BURXY|nr:unnamed protein product [Bursaphelenchus xylophilus]CAG9083424.1 unnamed protein product [Bursaphelenchus xylophilus]